MFLLPAHATNMDIMSRIGNISCNEPFEYTFGKFSKAIKKPFNGYLNLLII